MMRKFIGLITSPLAYLVASKPAFAQGNFTICPQNSQFNTLCNLNFNNIGQFIGNIIIILLVVAIIIAVIFLVYGGIKWILSGGDKTGVESARNHIIAAIVGLIIALLAFFIVTFVLGLLGLGSITTFNFPNLIPK